MPHPLSKYKPIADAVALLFHPSLEVVIHDIDRDEIFYIANPFSGRSPGEASLLKLTDEDLKPGDSVIGPYEKVDDKGQLLRSVTAVLPDESGKAVGLMCINADFSKHEAALELLESLIRPATRERHPEILFRNDWRDQIKFEIKSFIDKHDIPLTRMKADKRKELMARLDDKGLFYAKKSLEQVAGMLNISRATAYNDLNAVRKANNRNKRSF